jgi:ADP-dependent NAD(P)H-hydrate dehydratase / NAD(P)H-hydrate epimerase
VRLIWTAAQVRAAEERAFARTPAGVLMRRAAFAVAGRARELLAQRCGDVTGRRVALLVGAGNNGGDALWAGYELRRRGVAITALLLDPGRAHREGLAALHRAAGRVIDAALDPDGAAAAARRADLAVDGIVGISGRGPLRPAAAALVEAADAAGVPILAVDLPSGVDPDTGTTSGPAVSATATVTFGAEKPVHVLAPHRCGPVRLVDIGLGADLAAVGEPYLEVLEDADVAARWPVPGPADDKYTQGVVGVAAGSSSYPGAAVLATGAAVLAKSGMVRYAGSAASAVVTHWPEVVTAGSVQQAGQVQAWVVGPGLGTDEAGRRAVEEALAQRVPTCIDADAITLLAGHADLRAASAGRPVVITPHDREFARVAGEVGPDRVAAARRAASELRVTVLLKGNVTVVAEPGGRALAHPSTGSWAATAGSGDVLSGLIGALLAAGLDPLAAAGCATHLHGLAAELAAANAPAPASRLLAAVPAAVRVVRGMS